MIKKILALFTVTCLSFSMFNLTAFAQTKSQIDNTRAQLLTEDGNTSYYLDGNKLLKVVVETPQLMFKKDAIKNPGDIMTSTADVNVKFFESDPLSSEEIQQIKLNASSLTKTEEAINPMGNIRATLSVTYQWTSYGNPDLLKMISATSKYERISYEGVVPKTSSLYWNAEGDVYYSSQFDHRGSIGRTMNFSSPTFSNAKLMANSQSIAPLSAGATYTLNCTRGVTINVYLTIV